MRIHRIALCSFAGVDSAEVNFDTVGVTVIEGDNEAGKTTVVTALHLLLDRKVRDRSNKEEVKAIRPVHRDADPEVEADISTGPYRFVFSKRWGRTSSRNATMLEVTAPSREQLTGDEAHDRAYEILDETLDAGLLQALQVHQGAELLLPTFEDTELGAALDAAAGTVSDEDRHVDLWTAIEAEYREYWTPTGREKSSVAESRHQLEEAEAGVASLEEQLRGIESDAETAARLADDEERLAAAVADASESRDVCRRRVEAAEILERERHERLLAAREQLEAADTVIDEINLEDEDIDRKERQSEFKEAESAHRSAQTAVSAEEMNHAVLGASIQAAERATADARQRLESARAQITDEELDERVAATGATARTAQTARNSAQNQLEAADIDSLRSRLSNAEASAERAEDQLAANRIERRDLLVSLELRGEHGLDTRLGLARAERDSLAAEHRSLEARAAASKLLHEVFERRRAEAQQRYREPFKQHIERFGRIAYGGSFNVEVGDDLGIERRALDGLTLDVSQLSTGAREQLGIIARLACATLVSPDGGGAPVILDDALGWSDPARLKDMGAVINKAGDDCQIIILTCTPGRYAHVGNATVVRLPTS